MENTLHACTPARCAHTSTLLGNAPAGTLSNTLDALTLSALALISSLIAGGISVLLDQRSEIKDQGSVLCTLSSPNAKRPTLRPTFSPLVLRSSLVSGIMARSDYAISHSCTCLCCRSNHNRSESILFTNLDYSSIHPALQEALRLIHEKAPCRAKLTYLSSHAEKLQKWLSGALNGILYTLLSPLTLTIHNYQLSMHSRDFGLAVRLQKTLSTWACLDSCPMVICSRVGNRKTCNVFSVFNRKKTEPYTDEFVKRGTTLTNSSVYGTSSPLRYSLACALNAARCRAVAKQARRPASKPGVFKYTEMALGWLLPWFQSGEFGLLWEEEEVTRTPLVACVLLTAMVNGAEQVTRTVLDTELHIGVPLAWLPWLPQAAFSVTRKDGGNDGKTV